MPTDTQNWIMAILTFLSAGLVLAVKMLPMLSPDLQTYFLFGSALIDLALGVFFSRAGFRLWRARSRAKSTPK